MKVAIIGDGKMAHAIVPLAESRGHEVTAIVGLEANRDGLGLSREALGHPDVALEFTQPDAAVANILACVKVGVPVVVGTTGWYDRLAEVVAEVGAGNGTLFWAPNFSVGVAILGIAIEAATRALRGVAGFDVHLVETHHAAKKDRPSGTARLLADVAERSLSREVPVSSIRTGHVPGTHELIIDGAFEQLRLVHEARDRRLFAEGAVAAAEWVHGRRGVFTMKDVFGSGDAP